MTSRLSRGVSGTSQRTFWASPPPPPFCPLPPPHQTGVVFGASGKNLNQALHLFSRPITGSAGPFGPWRWSRLYRGLGGATGLAAADKACGTFPPLPPHFSGKGFIMLLTRTSGTAPISRSNLTRNCRLLGNYHENVFVAHSSCIILALMMLISTLLHRGKVLGS